MKRLARCAVISGSIGIFTAMALYISAFALAFLAHRSLNSHVIFALAPAMILGLADPTTLGGNLLLVGIVLGTNFVLYGFLGLALFGVWTLFRHLTTWLQRNRDYTQYKKTPTLR
jgi:uncharacterized membrane protein YesL